jgi:hypothetical protein
MLAMTSLGRILATAASTFVLSGTLVAISSATAHADSSWSGTLTSGISTISVGTESRTGYSRDLFNHWVDADGNGCDTRAEVLISEADTAPTVGSSCSLTGGRWYSYYEGDYQTSASALDIDHMVPLAEAWDSGASSWTTARRQLYANDLGDPRPLVAVTDNVNQSKSDQDPAEWMPSYAPATCQYLTDWVADKTRWRLTVDSAEKTKLTSLAAGCTNSTITVTYAY